MLIFFGWIPALIIALIAWFIFKIKKYKGKFTSNKEAAAIIRRFINGSSKGPYEWDDFESIEEKNPDVKLAIRLCWSFAGRFPAEVQTEYCGRKAEPYFLKIADVLENNGFQNIDYENAIKSLDKDIIPEEIKLLLDYKE